MGTVCQLLYNDVLIQVIVSYFFIIHIAWQIIMNDNGQYIIFSKMQLFRNDI